MMCRTPEFPAKPCSAQIHIVPFAVACPLAIAPGGNHVTPDIAPPLTHAAHP